MPAALLLAVMTLRPVGSTSTILIGTPLGASAIAATDSAFAGTVICETRSTLGSTLALLLDVVPGPLSGCAFELELSKQILSR